MHESKAKKHQQETMKEVAPRFIQVTLRRLHPFSFLCINPFSFTVSLSLPLLTVHNCFQIEVLVVFLR